MHPEKIQAKPLVVKQTERIYPVEIKFKKLALCFQSLAASNPAWPSPLPFT
jgi:hypothetical protein